MDVCFARSGEQRDEQHTTFVENVETAQRPTHWECSYLGVGGCRARRLVLSRLWLKDEHLVEGF